MAEVEFRDVGLERRKKQCVLAWEMRILDEREREGQRGNNIYLPIGNLPETLKDLLGRVLILGDTDHETDELLERHLPAPTRHVAERVLHLALVVHEPEAGERGAELELVQGIRQVPVKVPEDGLELFELDGRQVRHVARHHLVFEEGEFFRDGTFDEAEFVGELVVGVGREVVFFDVGFGALLVEEGEGGEKGVERGEVIIQALHVGALIVNVAFEAGYS